MNTMLFFLRWVKNVEILISIKCQRFCPNIEMDLTVLFVRNGKSMFGQRVYLFKSTTYVV